MAVMKPEALVDVLWCANTCLTHPHVYSCALDTVFDLFYFSIFPKQVTWETKKSTGVLKNLLECCELRWAEQNQSQLSDYSLSIIRENLWNELVNICPGLRPKGTSAATIDEIIHGFCQGLPNDTIFQYRLKQTCIVCSNTFERFTTSTIALTYSILNASNQSLPEAIAHVLYLRCENSCTKCKSSTDWSVIDSPKFLILELVPGSINELTISHKTLVLGKQYDLCGVVFANGTHFFPGIVQMKRIVLLDDMNATPNATLFRFDFARSNDMTISASDHVNFLVYSSSDMTVNLPAFNCRVNNKQRKRKGTEVVEDQTPKLSPKATTSLDILCGLTRGEQSYCKSSSLCDAKVEQFQHDSSDIPTGVFEVVEELHCENVETDVVSDVIDLIHNSRKSDEKLPLDIEMFNSKIKNIKQYCCKECHCLLFEEDVRLRSKATQTGVILSNLCPKCFREINEQGFAKFSTSNDLQFDDVPEQLKNLSLMERRLISLVHPFISIVILPGGQYGEKGQIIHFPSHLYELHMQIFDINKLSSNVIVLQAEESKLSIHNLVRLEKVVKALECLYEQNSFYMRCPVSTAINYLHAVLIRCKREAENVDLDFQESVMLETDTYVGKMDLNALISKGHVYSMPKHKSKPLTMFREINIEEMSFPWLLPTGRFGFSAKRKTRITLQKYFKNRLMSFEKRFQQDMLYLFYALCRIEFERLNSAVSIACSLAPKHNSMTPNAEQLESENPSRYFDKTYAFLSSVRGYGAYYRKQLRNLLAKVRLLGPPTWFLTLSAADSSELWPDLFQSLAQSTTCTEFSAEQRRMLLKQNPVLVCRLFRRRWQLFFKHVLKGKSQPLGDIQDYYVRVEFQRRGSPHLHIFLWIANAPKFQLAESDNAICSFVDQYVSTTLPNKETDPLTHDLVLRLQMHKHMINRCQKDATTKCRFDFPRPLVSNTRLRTKVDTGNPLRVVLTKRTSEQEQMLNAYNKTILITWKANHDIQFVGSIFGLCSYICAYLCKNEPRCLRNYLSDVVASLPPTASLRQKLFKIGCAVFSQRQVSAQEAAWRVLEFPYVESSRTAVYVNAYPTESRIKFLKSLKERRKLPLDSEDIYRTGIIEYYALRPCTEEFESISLYEFAENYVVVHENEKNRKSIQFCVEGKKLAKRSQKAAVILPRFSLPDDKESYFCSRLLAYLPWRSNDSLILPYASYEQSFKAHVKNLDQRCTAHENIESSVLKSLLVMSEIDIAASSGADIAESEVNSQVQDDYSSVETGYDIFNSRNLAAEIEKMSDVTECLSTKTTLNWADVFPADELFSMTDEQYLKALSSLTGEQGQLLSRFNTVYDTKTCSSVELTVKLFVSGPGGVGKSWLIKVLKEHLVRKTRRRSVLLTATTGVASHNVSGVTVHSALRLPVRHCGQKGSLYLPLSAEKLHELRRAHEYVEVVIIDECSMLSYADLIAVNLRLQEIFDTKDVFGGRHIVFFGDLYQLRPVCGRWIFSRNIATEIHLWCDLVRPIFLTINQRQKEDQKYFELLSRVRIGKPSLNDILAIQSRLMAHYFDPSFETAIRVYPTIQKCKAHNLRKTIELCKSKNENVIVSVARDVAIDLPGGVEIDHVVPESSRDCGGLEKEIGLVVGSRVMLTRNINVSAGLVNGQCATIRNFEYEDDELYCCILSFDDHTVGELFYNLDSGINESYVRVYKTTSRFFGKNSLEIHRTQFPLIPAWAVTIHKIQGQTLDKAVIDIGASIFGPAQVYVALSRVRKLSDIAVEEFDPLKIKADKAVPDEIQRLVVLERPLN